MTTPDTIHHEGGTWTPADPTQQAQRLEREPEYTYSVLLQYPTSYIAWADGRATYFTVVRACSPEHAARVAARECMLDTLDEHGVCLIDNIGDLLLLLVIPGAHPDVTPRDTITFTDKD
jgi:hypothetical protein